MILAHICAACNMLTNSWVDALMHRHPSIAALCFWGIGMLSYYQDAKYQLTEWAIISQIFSGICLTALAVFGFTHGQWLNFLVLPFLVWLQIQLTKRWWARPGKWW